MVRKGMQIQNYVHVNAAGVFIDLVVTNTRKGAFTSLKSGEIIAGRD